MSAVESMSFASSYVLASRVRSKLTKQAASPKSSLRELVLQANMLDNIMDHIALKTEQMKQEKRVSFSMPETIKHTTKLSQEVSTGPSVTEYEIDSDSDSDSDSEDYDYSSDDDAYNYYYTSDSEEETETDIADSAIYMHKKTMSVIDLSNDQEVSMTFEEHEDALPELTRSVSTSDSESEEDMPNFIISSAHQNVSSDLLLGGDLAAKDKTIKPQMHQNHHQRSSAIYSIESVF